MYMYVQESCIAGAYIGRVHTPRGPFVVIVKKNKFTLRDPAI